jgi:hypothetical protein
MVRGSNPGKEKRFLFSENRTDRLWGPLSLLFKGYREFFPGGKAAGVKLNPHRNLVLTCRRSENVPLMPLYAFMASTGTTLPLPEFMGLVGFSK